MAAVDGRTRRPDGGEKLKLWEARRDNGLARFAGFQVFAPEIGAPASVLPQATS